MKKLTVFITALFLTGCVTTNASSVKPKKDESQILKANSIACKPSGSEYICSFISSGVPYQANSYIAYSSRPAMITLKDNYIVSFRPIVDYGAAPADKSRKSKSLVPVPQNTKINF